MRKVIILLWLMMCPAWAQSTQAFKNFIGGLPTATSTTTGDKLYILQGGANKSIAPSAIGGGAVSSWVEPSTYGVTCDGVTDDTAAWATLMAAIPNSTIIQLPTSCITLTSQIDLSGKSTVEIMGTVAMSGGLNIPKPIIKYNGSAGGTMILCQPCADVVISGVSMDMANLADFGFKAVWSNTPFITQTAMFNEVTIAANSTGLGRPNAILIDWCGTGSTSNCEGLKVNNSQLICSGQALNGIGIRVGHGNAVGNGINGNFIQQCGQTAIYLQGMSYVSNSVLEINGIEITCPAAEPITILNTRSENSHQFFSGTCPVQIIGARFEPSSPTPAPCALDFGNGGIAAIVENMIWDAGDTLTPYCATSDFVVSIGNHYPNAAISGNRITSLQAAVQTTPRYSSSMDSSAATGVFNETQGPLYGSQIQPAVPFPVTGVVGTAQANQTAAGSSSGVIGYLNGSGSGAAVRGSSQGLGNAGVITEADMVAADFGNSAMIGNGTTAIGFKAVSPGGTVGTWTTIYGAYISPLATATIANAFGIYQAGASDGNVFAGPTTMASLSVTTGATCAAGTTSMVTLTVLNGIVTHC